MKTEGVETWRMFCAIVLPESVLKSVLQHIAHLKEIIPRAKASWARDARLHLTLKFIGEIPRTSVANFSEAVSRAVSDAQSFSIRLEQTGTFPTHGQPRVLWIGIHDPAEELGKLHARVEDESARAGFAKDTRAYHPHLTIARLRQPDNARALAAAHKQMGFEPVEIAVTELLVIRSELSNEGSKYSVVSRHPLFWSAPAERSGDGALVS